MLQHLSAVWSGVQQTVLMRQLTNGNDISGLVSMQRDAILNIFVIMDEVFSVNIFMLNG